MRSETFKIFVNRHRGIIVAYSVVIVVLTLFACNQADFMTKYGPQSIFNQVITLCLAALGQTLIIITGGVDLSVGFLIVLLNCVAATIMQPIIELLGSQLWGCVLTAVVIIGLGALCGAFNGAIVIYGRLQPIVVTLATGSIFYGCSRYVRPTPGGEVCSAFSKFLTGRIFDCIPTAAIVLLLVVLLIWIPFRNSRNGQALYAIGGNEYAAYVSGININRAKLTAYITAGIAYAVCGLILTAQTRSGDPTASNNYSNNSIAAVVLGGASLMGGKGSYWGSLAGAIILSLIVGLLIFWKVTSYYQNLIQGLILIAALSVDFFANLIHKKKARDHAQAIAKATEV